MSFPHIIRVFFGNCLTNGEIKGETVATVALDNSAIWDKISGTNNVTYFVNGSENAEALKKLGAKNVRLIDPRPLVHDQTVSFWYNKTYLTLAAFKEFGMKSEILYLDCDAQIIKTPDENMIKLLRERVRPDIRVLAPIRNCKRPKRVVPQGREADKHTCPCNCLMYCVDGEVISQMLELYPETAEKWGESKKSCYGVETTWWDDESVLMYWYDKNHGKTSSTQEIVDAFEPDIIRLQRHPPPEAVKKDELVYFIHH